MQDPFKKKLPLIEAVAALALPIVVDRAGGTLDVDVADLERINARYGGVVGVKIETLPGPGNRYRLTLALTDLKPEPPKPMA